MNEFAAPFQISHPSIGSLLTSHSMAIPELQRPFAWTEEEARELCRDLEPLVEALKTGRPDPQHFFGTLVVLTIAGGRDQIIDGQQRMTTITLLLGQLEHAFNRLNERCLAIARANSSNKAVADHHLNVSQNCTNVGALLHSLVWTSKGFDPTGKMDWQPRLKVSPEIELTYHSLISGEDGEVKSEKSLPAENLREVAAVFEHRLIEPLEFEDMEPREQFDHLFRLLTVCKEGLILVRLATAAAGAGYELFESLNARGIKLNALDHLKVWMLAVYAEEGIGSSVIANSMRALSSDDPEEQVHFFQHFYSARSGDTQNYDGMNNPKKLVLAARKLVFFDPVQEAVPDSMSLVERIETEVEYMDRLSPIWRRLIGYDNPDTRLPQMFEPSPNRDWISNRLELLLGATLKHQAAYPYLMVAAEKLKQNPEEFGDLVHLLERFFFRVKTICGVNEKKIVELYNRLIRAAEATGTVDVTMVRAELNKVVATNAPDPVFRPQLLAKLGYGTSAVVIRTKYFFEMLDCYSFKTKPHKRKGALDLSKWTLEHIVPQKPKSGDPFLSEEFVDSIGNLCLLPPWINIKLSNLNYLDKQKEAIRLRNLPGKEQVNIDLVDASKIFYSGSGNQWTESNVNDRIDALQDFACEVFSFG